MIFLLLDYQTVKDCLVPKILRLGRPSVAMNWDVAASKAPSWHSRFLGGERLRLPLRNGQNLYNKKVCNYLRYLKMNLDAFESVKNLQEQNGKSATICRYIDHVLQHPSHPFKHPPEVSKMSTGLSVMMGSVVPPMRTLTSIAQCLGTRKRSFHTVKICEFITWGSPWFTRTLTRTLQGFTTVTTAMLDF